MLAPLDVLVALAPLALPDGTHRLELVADRDGVELHGLDAATLGRVAARLADRVVACARRHGSIAIAFEVRDGAVVPASVR
jgi:hypothetical protein